MKKSVKTVISFVLITLIALSFSSCSVFQSMRENALNAAQATIYATPEKDQIISEYNTLLAASLKDATEIKENVSYSAGKPDVFKAVEEAGVLDAAANQLKTFIMSAKPGSASTVLEADAESLLKALDEAAVLEFDFTRNIATENVTDEKGNWNGFVPYTEGSISKDFYIRNGNTFQVVWRKAGYVNYYYIRDYVNSQQQQPENGEVTE